VLLSFLLFCATDDIYLNGATIIFIYATIIFIIYVVLLSFLFMLLMILFMWCYYHFLLFMLQVNIYF